MSKILITGASGFVGSWLVKEALSRDLDVYAGIRASSSKALLTDPKINFSIIDFEDDAVLAKLLKEEQFDYIIHNAGVTRAQNDSDYFRVNVDYTLKLARMAQEQIEGQLKKFIFISSIEAYGSADDTPDQVVNNSIAPSPRTTYGQSKLRAERALAQVEGLPLIILRPTAVFGPGERDLFAFWQTVKKYKITPVVGNKTIKYTFVYVKDLVRVVIDAALSDISGRSYFVSDGRIHKMQDYLSNIAASLKIKPFGFTIPYVALDTAVIVTGIIDKLTGKKSLLNAEQIAKAKAQNWDCDISDLVRDFAYQSKYSLEEAVEETTQWYLQEGWL